MSIPCDIKHMDNFWELFFNGLYTRDNAPNDCLALNIIQLGFGSCDLCNFATLSDEDLLKYLWGTNAAGQVGFRVVQAVPTGPSQPCGQQRELNIGLVRLAVVLADDNLPALAINTTTP